MVPLLVGWREIKPLRYKKHEHHENGYRYIGASNV